MSGDEAGQWDGTEDYVQRLEGKKKKKNGGEIPCFRILFASDAEAGIYIDDSNGSPFMRAAII